MQSTILSLSAFLLVLYLITKPLGLWIEPLAMGRSPILLTKADAGLLKLFRITEHQQPWWVYGLCLLAFNMFGVVLLYVILRMQAFLPLNPEGFEAMSAHQAFNTAVSFVTNTNWQSYAGETTLSHFSQMAGLTVQNFVSAATGICVAFVLIRAFSRHETVLLGNFWVDLVRVTFWLLLPLCVLYGLFLVCQGVPQTFVGSVLVSTFGGSEQHIALGPVASQEAIKLLGTNGGGFFNANSSHPFENPTQLSNFIECLSIFAIPSALVWVFGRMVKNPAQGWTIWSAMAFIFVCCVLAFAYLEGQSTPLLSSVGVGEMNMEGKEVRFDLAATSLFSIVTTSASCGAVNAMHDSLTALGGMIPMWLMQLGEVVFGGVGSGLYGMLVFAIVTVFISGLMVGRTPEYLGKKITPVQMKLACIAMLTTPILVLTGISISCMYPDALTSLNNAGAHGLSELLYAWSSAANNNGSAFAGLNANTWFFNIGLALAMWFGRFIVILAVIALAGSLAGSRRAAVGSGTLPTTGPLFAALLVGVIVLVGALTYLPALALGPIAEHATLWLPMS